MSALKKRVIFRRKFTYLYNPRSTGETITHLRFRAVLDNFHLVSTLLCTNWVLEVVRRMFHPFLPDGLRLRLSVRPHQGAL